MLKIHPIKNFLKIEKNFIKRNENIIKNKGRNYLSASLFALSVLGLSSINSCTKELEIEKPKKIRQIDSSLVKKDTTKKEEKFLDIVVDESLEEKNHYIFLTM